MLCACCGEILQVGYDPVCDERTAGGRAFWLCPICNDLFEKGRFLVDVDGNAIPLVTVGWVN